MLFYIKIKLKYSANAHLFTFFKIKKCKSLHFHSEWKDKIDKMTILNLNFIH